MTTNNNTDFEQQPIEGEQQPNNVEGGSNQPNNEGCDQPNEGGSNNQPNGGNGNNQPNGGSGDNQPNDNMNGRGSLNTMYKACSRYFGDKAYRQREQKRAEALRQ